MDLALLLRLSPINIIGKKNYINIIQNINLMEVIQFMTIWHDSVILNGPQGF